MENQPLACRFLSQPFPLLHLSFLLPCRRAGTQACRHPGPLQTSALDHPPPGVPGVPSQAQEFQRLGPHSRVWKGVEESIRRKARRVLQSAMGVRKGGELGQRLTNARSQ